MVSIAELKVKCGVKYGTCPWRTEFARKISIYFTWFFIKTPITPNQITFIMFMLGLASAVLFMFGNYWLSLAAVLSLLLAFMLDHSDGEVARYKNLFSFKGVYLDLMQHAIVNPLIVLGIAIGAYFGDFVYFDNFIFLILGFLGAFGLMIINFAKLKKYEAYINYKKYEELKKLYDGILESEEPKGSKIKNEILKLFHVSIFDAIFIFTVLDILPYLTIFYGALYPLYAVKKFYSEFKST
jgi:phosphatidylglycerophosphate synthase